LIFGGNHDKKTKTEGANGKGLMFEKIR